MFVNHRIAHTYIWSKKKQMKKKTFYYYVKSLHSWTECQRTLQEKGTTVKWWPSDNNNNNNKTSFLSHLFPLASKRCWWLSIVQHVHTQLAGVRSSIGRDRRPNSTPWMKTFFFFFFFNKETKKKGDLYRLKRLVRFRFQLGFHPNFFFGFFFLNYCCIYFPEQKGRISSSFLPGASLSPFSTINTFRKVKKKNISIGLEGMLGGSFSYS